MDLPGIISPDTTSSPVSPVEITIRREAGSEEPISFSDCQQLARAVSQCSKSLIEGNWVEVSDVRGTKPRFIPNSFESAKAFLRDSLTVKPTKKITRSESDTPVSSHPKKKFEMGVCHQCHGPIGAGAHQGSAFGKGVCTHIHSHFCRGGIAENDSWAPCPPTYQYNHDLDLASGQGFENTMNTFNFQAGVQQNGPTSSTPAISTTPASSNQPPGLGSQQAVQPQFVPANQLPPTVQVPHSSESFQERYPGVLNGDGRRLLSREYPPSQSDLRVPGMVHLDGGAARGVGAGPNLPHPSSGISENIQSNIDHHRALNQNERYAPDRPSGEINITNLRQDPRLRNGVEDVMSGFISQQVPALSAAPSAVPPADPAPRPPASGQMYSQYHNGGGDGIRVYADGSNMGARSRNYDPQPQGQPSYPQVRQPHGIPQHQLPPQQPTSGTHYQYGRNAAVASQHSFPAYTPARSHPGNALGQQFVQQPQQGQPQPAAVSPHQGQARLPGQDTTQYRYDWVTDSTGRETFVRIPVAQQQAVHHRQVDAAPVQQQYRTEYRCSPTSGRQWTVQVPISSNTPSSPQAVYEWRIHPHTGERYQVPVQVPAAPLNQLPVNQPPAHHQPQPYVHPQQSSSAQHHHQVLSPRISPAPGRDNSYQVHQSVTQVHDQSADASLTRHERVAGIVSLLDGVGGTKKLPKIVEFAKKCPTKWSKQATLSNINLPLYAWGVIEEVEASLSGRSQAMPDAVVLGKLRHLKNTLEVCCQNSTSQDFTGYGWTLARDYSTKLNDEIDQGRATWQGMALEVKTSTLMSASMENPRPPPKFEGRGFEGRGFEGRKPNAPKAEDKKELCTTYNRCLTEHKCDYEVANPSKTCLKKHECSWCRTNKHQSWKHQASKCRNKAHEVGG